MKCQESHYTRENYIYGKIKGMEVHSLVHTGESEIFGFWHGMQKQQKKTKQSPSTHMNISNLLATNEELIKQDCVFLQKKKNLK